MTETVFFSWQADTPTRTGRNLIERALENAIAAISEDAVVEAAIRDQLTIDRDTKGVPGSPPIVDTIFRKIDAAAVFVPDLTFVGTRKDKRPTPNPNVLIEYGWALRSLGHVHMVPVMNIAYGQPTSDNMPFDLAHLRRPLLFNCPEDADDETRAAIRNRLAADLKGAIKAVLISDGHQRRRLPESHFVPREPKDGRGRFRTRGEVIGLVDWVGNERPSELQLADHPVSWLRVMPLQGTSGREFGISRLRQLVRPYGNVNALPTLSLRAGDPLYVRAVDGFGTWDPLGNKDDVASAVAFAFTTGEIWSVEQRALRNSKSDNFIPLNEKLWVRALTKYTEFLQLLKSDPPFRWIAGMEDLKGRGLYPPGSNLKKPLGACATDVIEVAGMHAADADPRVSLGAFFNKICQKRTLSQAASECHAPW